MSVLKNDQGPTDQRSEQNPGTVGREASGNKGQPYSVIGRDICIEGELEGSENLLIEGRVKGRIQNAGDVTVSAGSHVEARIVARNITIQGRVNGNIEAREAVEIRETGILIGDCRARSIQIREGARFEGRSEILT
ncbi:MAG: polymer-forming cytoskeletal protein [Desulfobacterales bacterium]|jgi:cytoskeletal protein CcmA (bactofilin family)